LAVTGSVTVHASRRGRLRRLVPQSRWPAVRASSRRRAARGLRRSGAIVAILSALAVSVSLLAAPAGSATPKPPPHPTNKQLQGAQAQKNALADQVGRLSGQIAYLQGRIARLDAAAELAEQKLAYALAQLAQAKDDAMAALRKVAAARAAVDKAAADFRAFVRASYMGSPIDGAAGSLLTAPDPSAVLQRNDYLEYSAGHKLDAIGDMNRATVAKSNADAVARAAVQHQTALTAAAKIAKQNADAAVSAAQAERQQLNADLASSQSRLAAAQSRLATLNHQRTQYLAWVNEQARIAAAKRAADARRRQEAMAAAQARGSSAGFVPIAASTGSWNAAAGQTAVNRAMQYLGIRYAFAAGNVNGPTNGVCVAGDARNDCHVFGFDCSGLSLYAWAPYLHLDHYAATQYSQAGSYHPGTSNLLPGDLVFWSSNGSQSGIHHVAIYIGNGNVIQAPQSGDIVRVTPLGEVGWGYFGATRPMS
jgi:cell wall-associated NlpC family hydrolase